MAITLVQAASSAVNNLSNTSNIIAASFPASTTAGNTIIAAIGGEAGNPFSISGVTLGTLPDNFTAYSEILESVSGTSALAAIWVDPGCAGGQSSVTVTLSLNSTSSCLYIYEVSGLGAADLDQIMTNGSTAGGTTWTSNATVTTSAAAEFWVGIGVGRTATSNPTMTGPAGPWINESGTTFGNLGGAVSGYQITTGTGAATYSGTSSVTLTGYAAAVITLEAGTATTFPTSPLGLSVEILLNGTWTDISDHVYQRSPITISNVGRPDETQNAQSSSLTMVLNNTDGRFTPLLSSGIYYPYITRNTQVRVSVASQSSTGQLYSGFRFWGQIAAWPVAWDPTGNDIYVTVQASGIFQQISQNTKTIGSAMRRFVTYLPQTSLPAVGYWPCEDGTNSSQIASAIPGIGSMTVTGSPSLASDTSFFGSNAMLQLNGASLSGTVGSFSSGTTTFSTPGTHNWLCPGGISTVQALAIGPGGGAGGTGVGNGGGGGGGGEAAQEASVAVTAGNNYIVVVGAGGSGGAKAGNGQAGSGPSTFTGNSVTVTANAGGGGKSNGNPGSGGSGSTNTTHFSGGGGGTSTGRGGAGGGGSAGNTGAGGAGGSTSTTSAGTAGTAGTGGGAAGGAGGTGSNSGSGATAGHKGSSPGGGGGGAGSETSNGFSGGNGAPGSVTLTYSSSTTPPANVLRFLVDVPAKGGTNGAIYAQLLTAGTIAKVNVIYGTGGTFQVIGYNAGGSALFTSTPSAPAGGFNGVPCGLSVELTPSGSSVAWTLNYVTPGLNVGVGVLASGTVASASVGGMNTVNINPGNLEVGAVGIGHIIVQNAVTPQNDMAAAACGYNQEVAAVRLARILTQQGIPFEIIGNETDTPQMGPQADITLMQTLQQIEDLDCGLLYECRDQYGIGYRTRISMTNQLPALTLNYTSAHLVEPLDINYDDQLARNDIQLTRSNGVVTGSSVEVQDTTDTMSVNSPPNGIGYYTYQRSVNAFQDSQLVNEATWLLTLGTVDDFRYPKITLDMRRTEVAALFSTIPSTRLGDMLQLINMPSWMPNSTVNQLVWGWTETLNAFEWTIELNTVPEAPYATALNNNLTAYNNSIAGWNVKGTSTLTSVSGASLPANASYPFALKITSSAGSSGADDSGGAFFVTPGAQYTFSALVNCTTTSVLMGAIWELNSVFVTFGSHTFTVTANTWTPVSFTFTAPTSGINKGYIEFQVGSGNSLYVQYVVCQAATNIW